MGLPGSEGCPVSPPQQQPQRWDFVGHPSDFKSGPTAIPCFGFAGFPGSAACGTAIPAVCTSAAAALGLSSFPGCYAKGNSALIPPPAGQFGTMGRNIFPDSGFRNLDFSIAKNWHFGERLRAQFRAEFFNLLNHPNFANPYGGQNGYGNNDPGALGSFGCECVTPDVIAANPAIGSGGPRSIQLGLKFIF